MNNFTFFSPTEFVFGRDTELKTGELMQKHAARRVLIVYGGGSAVRSGLLGRIEASLDAAGVFHISMGGIQANPVDGPVYKGIEIARRNEIDLVLAVGGGSVIDTSKAIAAGVPYEGDFWDFYIGKAKVTKALRVAVVLTIPAAGSEGSGNSVITKESTRQKMSLRAPEQLRPVFAVMNPVLTFTLPAWQTAAGVTDMMAHIFERYFTNTPAVTVADRMCEGVLQAIIEEAPKVIVCPNDYDARANIMWCGMVAHNGTCGVGCEEDWATHFMEHEISAYYGVTHGAGLAVMFPAWLTWMADHHVERVALWAHRVWGVAEQSDLRAQALEGIARFKAFLQQIGMPTDFKSLGVPNPDIPLLVDSLHRNKGEYVGAYVRLTRKDSEEIYRLAL